jgi:hypothetical protein
VAHEAHTAVGHFGNVLIVKVMGGSANSPCGLCAMEGWAAIGDPDGSESSVGGSSTGVGGRGPFERDTKRGRAARTYQKGAQERMALREGGVPLASLTVSPPCLSTVLCLFWPPASKASPLTAFVGRRPLVFHPHALRRIPVSIGCLVMVALSHLEGLQNLLTSFTLSNSRAAAQCLLEPRHSPGSPTLHVRMALPAFPRQAHVGGAL